MKFQVFSNFQERLDDFPNSPSRAQLAQHLLRIRYEPVIPTVVKKYMNNVDTFKKRLLVSRS